MRKPAGVLRTGSLKITSVDGQTLEIKLGLNMQYEWTLRVVQSFKPEAVTLDRRKGLLEKRQLILSKVIKETISV